MINKIKSKINAFRWYLNNQQAGYVYQATSQELQNIFAKTRGIMND